MVPRQAVAGIRHRPCLVPTRAAASCYGPGGNLDPHRSRRERNTETGRGTAAFLAFTRGGAEFRRISSAPGSQRCVRGPNIRTRKGQSPASWVFIPAMTVGPEDQYDIASWVMLLRGPCFRLWVDGRRAARAVDVPDRTPSSVGTRRGTSRSRRRGSSDRTERTTSTLLRLPPRGGAASRTSRVHATHGIIASARFSPDGSHLVFTSYRTGEAEIYTANADGSSATQLTRGLIGIKGLPAWSPDGKQVAFDFYGADGQGDVTSSTPTVGRFAASPPAPRTRACQAGRATGAGSTSVPTGAAATRFGGRRWAAATGCR